MNLIRDIYTNFPDLTHIILQGQIISMFKKRSWAYQSDNISRKYCLKNGTNYFHRTLCGNKFTGNHYKTITSFCEP